MVTGYLLGAVLPLRIEHVDDAEQRQNNDDRSNRDGDELAALVVAECAVTRVARCGTALMHRKRRGNDV